MLDALIRPMIDPPLKRAGRTLASWGIRPNGITLLGFGFGVIACLLVAHAFYLAALGCLFINRVCDGLDGGIAHSKGRSDFGGFLDIVCDFLIYAGLVFAFVFSDSERAFAAAFLLFSFIGPITSFLAFAIVAEKRGIKTVARGQKTFYYLGGVCEGSETFLTLILLCLFPHWFAYIAFSYGLLCWITTGGRILQARQTFKDS